MKKTLTILSLAVSMFAYSEIDAQIVVQNDTTFNTAEQMLLANELFESGEPFAEALGYNLDNLDPMVLNSPDSMSYTFGIENYEYSRYLLGTVISRSGIGLHMMWAPMVKQMAAMEDSTFDGMYTRGMQNGFKEDDEMMKMMMHFGMLANQMAPANAWPQFADFESGNMTLPQNVAANFHMDFGSLRFDRSKMDKTLNLAAMGQTMLKQYFWASDMLGGYHDSLDNGVTPTGTNSPDSVGSPNFDPMNNIYYGGNNADGFIGQVLTAESINKTLFLINKMAYDGTTLGMVDPATYSPANGIKYFPHRVAVTEQMMGTMLPPMMDTLIVTDASSQIFDQLSFLWATLSFKNMMDPSKTDADHYAFHEVFDGNPFPAPMSVTGMPGPFDLMMGASKVIFLNSQTMHFNMTEGVFVDEASLNASGAVVMGNEVSSVNAGYMLVVLAKMVDEFAGTPLATMASSSLTAQTNFIIAKLKNSSNGYYNGYTIGTGAMSTPLTLESVAAITRGLYASYNSTGMMATLTEANMAYNYMINNFYMPSKMIFKTTMAANAEVIYTPFNIATVSGAMREANLTGNQAASPAIYTRFSKAVVNKMWLAEAEESGESGNDSDGDGIPYIVGGNRPFVLAAQAKYDFTTGVEQSSSSIAEQINMYPNPATDFINIDLSLSQSSNVKISIYDIAGKLVRSQQNEMGSGTQNLRISVGNLNAGVYFVQFIMNNEMQDIKRMVITK